MVREMSTGNPEDCEQGPDPNSDPISLGLFHFHFRFSQQFSLKQGRVNLRLKYRSIERNRSLHNRKPKDLDL